MDQLESESHARGGGIKLPAAVRFALIVSLLYLFLVGVKLLEGGIKALGSDFTDTLFEGVTNPLAGLFVGILATVLVQSSSVTTATIVGLVAAGVLDVGSAVPMIMGANIGTTVTNTIVSMAHMRRTEEFRLALTAATMHDFFNLLAVAVLLPFEVATGFLEWSAEKITSVLVGSEGLGGSFDSPIKGAVKWLAGIIEDVIESAFSAGTAAGTVGIIVGIGLIFLTLTFITKNMRLLVASRIERSLNAALARSGLVGITVGIIVTVAVQSSSITTSILIPLAASGVLTIPNAFPITLGANLGTTVTALLAALGAGAANGLTIAIVHTLFNFVAIAVFYPWPPLRRVPIVLAGRLADLAVERRVWAVAYLLVAFIAIPLLGIVILR
ncbi:MAG: Na/Pi symporter [Acidimicrobiia bacterium]|nr:Na/Pi symporter [Acidimicrobiia bacterium]